MKFIYPDSLDFVDPNYDFLLDEFAPGRKPYWDDQFAHEIMKTPPYDGLLMSRALLGVDGLSGKYPESQAMRFARVGAKEFFRLNQKQSDEFLLFGDCGAFSYSGMEIPPYTATDMVEFYEYGGFTHGCAIDHIIFEFSADGPGSEESRRRFDITLDLAEKFMAEHKRLNASFVPVGVAQGWSPASLARATKRLLEIGYNYIAIGGLVPLNLQAIRSAVTAVSNAMKMVPDGKIHLLGFAKAEGISEFTKFKVASFDSTSPLLRAFKDSTRNYWLPGSNSDIDYYSAIRVPQTYANNTLMKAVKRGKYSQDELLKAETIALTALRSFDRDNASIPETLDAVLKYSWYLIAAADLSDEKVEHKLLKLKKDYTRTLELKPWKKCECNICVDCSIEVIIFRASNRNKRRGMHNLYTFHNHTKHLLLGSSE